ncbi:MAG: PqqD family protein [Flexilinea sp.]
MDLSDKPKTKPNFNIQNLDNELVLFNTENLNVLYLNQSASVIWQLCDGSRSIREIIDMLSDAYPEAYSDMETDVKETIHLFLSHEALDIK